MQFHFISHEIHKKYSPVSRVSQRSPSSTERLNSRVGMTENTAPPNPLKPVSVWVCHALNSFSKTVIKENQRRYDGTDAGGPEC